MNFSKLKLVLFFAVVAIIQLKAQNYNLVWEDNFDGATLDSSIWNIEEKVGVWNTGQNAEFQHYRRENVSVGDDGNGNNCLILTAKEENYNGYGYTSGKVTTKGKLAFRRGKLEAMIKIPDLANGLWPAFWTLGYTSLGWPDCGEIDVLEMGHAQGISDGVQNSFIGAHLFWGPFPRDWGKEYVAAEDLSTGYYKHTVIWNEQTISVFFNDESTPYFSMGIEGDDTEEFRDFQHYIIFNMAVGGSVPGIYDKADITADMPANMYIDWVRIYQEEGSEDLNSGDLPIFGEYGVYEETSSTTMSMTHNFDLFDITSGVNKMYGATPYEGDSALSYSIQAGSNFQLNLQSGLQHNMTNYSNGAIQLAIKTDIIGDIQIGISDSTGNSDFITINDQSEIVIDRSGEWQVIAIPLADIISTVDITAIKDFLIIKGTASAESVIEIDQVLYKEVAPAKGYYGIITDNPAITEGFVVDNVNYNMYIWDNTVAFNEELPAYEGEGVLSFKATGTQGWSGYGYHSSKPLNFQAYENGFLNISMRAAHNAPFVIGMDGDDSNAEITFNGTSDPYGFERNGEWNHLTIPVNDLVVKGLNLTSIKHVFKFSGGGDLKTIAFDNIFLSEDTAKIDNSVICYLQNISVTPASATIEAGQNLSLKATALNQFGKPFEQNIAWSSNGGTVTPSGVFSASVAGNYTVTATQADKSTTISVTVEEASGVNPSIASGIFSYYNSELNSVIISGLKQNSMVTLVSTDGRIISQSIHSSDEAEINMTGQLSGIYFVKVTEGDSIYTNKILKR